MHGVLDMCGYKTTYLFCLYAEHAVHQTICSKMDKQTQVEFGRDGASENMKSPKPEGELVSVDVHATTIGILSM